jgi:hypothetical protein
VTLRQPHRHPINSRHLRYASRSLSRLPRGFPIQDTSGRCAVTFRHVRGNTRQPRRRPPPAPARPSCGGCVSLRGRSRGRRYQSSAKISSLPAVPRTLPLRPHRSDRARGGPYDVRAALIYRETDALRAHTRMHITRDCGGEEMRGSGEEYAAKGNSQGNGTRRSLAGLPLADSHSRTLPQAPPVIALFPGCVTMLQSARRWALLVSNPSLHNPSLHPVDSPVDPYGKSPQRKHRDFSSRSIGSIRSDLDCDCDERAGG